MRLSRFALLAVLSAALIGSALPVPANAQQVVSNMPCHASTNIVRVSNINPGMMEKFMQAVQAQKAWYKKHGLDDEISVMRVLEQDPTTKAWKYSDRQAITTHVQAKQNQQPKDAEWDAFVAMFAASSKIEKSYLTCMPDSM